MKPYIKNQTKVITFLSTESLYIDRISQLEQMRFDGEYLLKCFKAEICNNHSRLIYAEYLEYLTALKEHLWGFFIIESYENTLRSTLEYNLRLYHSNYQVYGYKWDLQEYKEIAIRFDNSLVFKAKESLRKLLGLKSPDKAKPLKQLPYTRYHRDEYISLLNQVQEAGLLEHFHNCVNKHNDCNHVNHPDVKDFFKKFLILGAEMLLTQFLWYSIGFISTTIEQIKAQEATLYKYVRHPNYEEKIIKSLTKGKVIDSHKQWIGITLVDLQHEGEFYSDKKAIIALKDSLIEKGYIFRDDPTPLGRALCKTFHITQSDTSLRRKHTMHDFMVLAFNELLPDLK